MQCVFTHLVNDERKHIKIRWFINYSGTLSVTASISDWFQLNVILILSKLLLSSVLYGFMHGWVLYVPKLASLIYLLATQIFDLLESELPVDFNKKFGLSWNLLKASVGSQRGKAQ